MKTKLIIFRFISACILMVPLILLSCTGTGSSKTFEQILSIIPDTQNNRASVSINDYTQMRKLFGINPIGKDATAEEQLEYIQNLISMGSGNIVSGKMISPAAPIGFINNNLSYAKYSFDSLHNMGLGYWAIDQEAAAGRPPATIAIIKGQFDPKKTREALAISAKDDPPATEMYLENTIFSWAKDYEVNLTKVLTPPAYDFLGRGGRFVFQEKYTFRTNGTDDIKLLLDAQNGTQASLADVDDYKLIGRELSSQGAMSAFLTDQTQSISYIKSRLSTSGDIKAGDIEKYLSQGPNLLPYQTIGLGLTKDEQGLCALIILVHTDNEAASKNVNLLKQRIEETNSVYTGAKWTSWFPNSSITSRGRVLTAKLYGENAGRMWILWFYSNDPLILHE